MDRRIWIAVLAVIVVVAVAIAVVALNSSGATVVVQEDQSGQTIEVSEGDTLELQLTGNPTTGYNWQTTQIDDAVLTQSGDPSFDPDTELLGSPGVITMTYDTVGAGTSPLALDYGPVAGGAAENTFQITVFVSS